MKFGHITREALQGSATGEQLDVLITLCRDRPHFLGVLNHPLKRKLRKALSIIASQSSKYPLYAKQLILSYLLTEMLMKER